MIEPKWKYMSAEEVCNCRGCKKTKLYGDIKAGLFPIGERLGMNTVRWRSDVVAAWLEERSRNAVAMSDEAGRKAQERAQRAVEGRRRKRAAAARERRVAA